MKLVYLNGDNAGKSVELTPSGLTIGRETDNHLQLPVGGVSRYHARIEFVEGAYMLRDLGSTNGTKLNGVALPHITQLKADDIIVIGEQQLQVVDAAPDGGKTDSKIGTSTVKIPAGIPVPEPAVPQFVFRPDSEPQPPPPPPVTDSSETATVNIAPEIAEAGNDFFAKRDSDGNLFKKDETKKDAAKSSLRSNLIFGLIIVIMVCGGILLFRALNQGSDKTKKDEPQEKKEDIVNNDFSFYYETQSADEKTQKLTRKKVFCRQDGDTYVLDMFFDDDSVRVQEEKVRLETDIVKRLKEANKPLAKYAGSSVRGTDPGSEKEWTRLVVCVGDKVHDATVIGRAKDLTFLRAEKEVLKLIESTEYGERMMSQEELKEKAESYFQSANNYYKSRETRPNDHSLALEDYRKAYEAYRSLNQLTDSEQKNQAIAFERMKELAELLEKKYEDAIRNAEVARNQKQYDQAIQLCRKAKQYFQPGKLEYEELNNLEKECTALIREQQQKGKK